MTTARRPGRSSEGQGREPWQGRERRGRGQRSNPPSHSPRPGAGQSRHRASRGWHPATIADAYLLYDEDVKLEETRSVRGFLMSQLPSTLAVLAAVVLVALLKVGVVTMVAFIGLAMFSVLVGIRALQASFTRYVVTDLRVLRVSGVLNRQAEFIPWGKVTDITRRESLGQWIAHTATICIESANERSGFRSIDDVDDPDEFYRTVVRMVDLKQGRLPEPE